MFGLKIVWKKSLLAGDKFMPETHLRQPEFTSNACGLFTKNKKIMKKFKKREIQDPFLKTNWIEPAFKMI